ncbi:hypothetical protein VTJ49DRAFT_1651 [Mycothermus thermophilus]|uniref:Uncharacterized protein n=1 Tax=Humicola insolens TaxID=85995 RepID=A0ABR3VC80_HUMIN
MASAPYNRTRTGSSKTARFADDHVAIQGRYAPTIILILGTSTFLLYTLHYIFDYFVLRLTFVPGTLVRAITQLIPAFLRFRLDPSIVEGSTEQKSATLKFLLSGVVPVVWRGLVGESYRLGPAFRNLDWYMVRSYELDLAACVSGVLYVAALAWFSSGSRRGEGKRWSWKALWQRPWAFVVNIFNPWHVLEGLGRVVFVAVVYPWVFTDLPGWGLALLFAGIYYTHHQELVPYGFQHQLIGSVLRLWSCCAYVHQVQFLVFVAEIVYLTRMLRYVQQLVIVVRSEK